MSALIDELKKEHSEIITIFNEAKGLGILSREGQAKLMTVKARLLTHLKKEDEQLYPVLRKKAENNKFIKNTLDIYAINIEDVSRVVIEFFDKYSGEVLGTELQEEFDRLFAVLSIRIRSEEDILYEVYEKMNQ